MNEPALIENVTLRLLTELLQSVGYRTNESEQGGVVQLLSASQGIGFAVRFGNPASEQGGFIDFTLSCALRVNGLLPEGLVPRWNQIKRFSRLSEQGGFLVLEMDVIVAGGVSQRYLRANIELWDRLLQEFLLYLRTFTTAQPASPVAGAGQSAPVAEFTDVAFQADVADQVPHTEQPSASAEAGNDADPQSESAAHFAGDDDLEAVSRETSVGKGNTNAVVL